MQEGLKEYMARILTFRRKSGTLLYCGVYRGDTLNILWKSRRYDRVFGIEANPDLISFLKNKFLRNPEIKIFNYALCDFVGEIEFNISSNLPSSSLFEISHEYNKHHNRDFHTVKKVKVKTITIDQFCKEQNIDTIDFLVTDLEGNDILALKGATEMLKKRKIKKIQSEVEFDNKIQVHKTSVCNKFSAINEFLKGYGFIEVPIDLSRTPEPWLSYDATWVLK